MKFIIHLFLLLIIFSIPSSLFAQTKGKYIPTKYDSIKKKVPQQVYGNKAVTPPVNLPVTEPEVKEVNKTVIIQEENNKISEPNVDKKKEIKSTVKPKKESAKPSPAVKPIPSVPKLAEENENISTNQFAMPKGSKWSLQQCIQYAMDNNLQVAESELNKRMAQLVLSQNKYSRLPSLNGDATFGDSYGRSIDPTSNQFVTKGFLYNTLGLSTQALLFGWFQKKYQIEQNELDLAATQSAYNQLKDDIALNVATGFLRVLLAREQVKINEAQLKLNNEQFKQTVKFAEAGKLPELNVAQMSSQLSTDSASVVSANADERIALLQLRALMNFNFEQDFDIQAPEMNMSEMSTLLSLPSPESIYNVSVKNQHRMKYNDLKLQSANKTLDIAKASQYPTISFFGTLGTNYSSVTKDITGQTYIGETPLGYLKIAGTDYELSRPEYSYTTRTRSLGNQYGDNVRANAGLSLNVPIFNGFIAGTNIQKAKIGLVSQQIATDNDRQKLKQDIYKAYEEAKASAQKFNAATRARDAAERALDFAVKRFAVGMINTFEYTSTLNSLNNANSSVLSSKYDLIFKMKVLDYYMGNPLKL